MLDLAERARPVFATAALWIVAGSAAILGCVWLSFAGVTALGALVGPAAAMAIVGVLAFAPLAVLVVLEQRRKHDKAEAQKLAAAAAASRPDDIASALSTVTRLYGDLVHKHPMAAMGLAALAGLLVTRFPSALALLARVAEGMIETLNRQDAAPRR